MRAQSLLLVVAWANALLWLVAAILTWRGLRRQQPLAPVRHYIPTGKPTGESTDMDAPLVSILVPARNEEHRVLAEAVRSMLAQDYARTEVIAVNDRSSDATGEILRGLAREHAALRVVEGVEPPAGWLGKPHALQQALAASCGEWVLATDADIIFAPEAVGTALKLALEDGRDAVTLIPKFESRSFWERVFMPTFGWFMMMNVPLNRVNNPERPEAIGIGGFFLIRRKALARIGDYSAVRFEVAEDLRMAELLKQSRARLRVEYAPDLISTLMYSGLKEIWSGFTKNLFAGVKYSVWRSLGGSLTVVLFSVLPPLVALVCAAAWASGAGGELPRLLFLPTFAVWILQVLNSGTANLAWGVPFAYALTMPLGHAIFVAILLNSTLRISTGSGVTWKDRRLYTNTPAPAARSRTLPNDSR